MSAKSAGKLIRLLAVAIGVRLIFSSAAEAVESADLGQGLAYLRVHSLAESDAALREAVRSGTPLVLDLRYATLGNGSPDALADAVAHRPADSELFVLTGPSAPGPVIEALAKADAPRVITLGPAETRPPPTVPVKTDATTDRRAYDAADSGTPIAELISGRIDKERFDEATLVHEFNNGNPDAEPPQAPDPSAPKAPGTPEEPPPLIDRVLQRAVHLHRALAALKPAG